MRRRCGVDAFPFFTLSWGAAAGGEEEDAAEEQQRGSKQDEDTEIDGLGGTGLRCGGVALRVGYKNAGEQQELSIPVTLPPGDTQVLSLHPYLENVIPQGTHWASLEVNYTSRSSGLAAAMVSVSQDGAHSIRSVLNWVEANMREGWHWRADRDHNTLLGIYNADSEPAQVKVSLDYYSDGQRQSYDLPELTLAGRAAELVDIGAILTSGQPDAEGNRIPRNITFGGYRVWKTAGAIGTAIVTEALVIDRRTRNFLTFYNTGCCYTSYSSYVSPSSITAPVGAQGNLVVTAYHECLGWVDVTWDSQFYSQDSSIASAGSGGYYSFQNPGTTTLNFDFSYMAAYLGQCFQFLTDDGGCSVTVKPTVSISGPANLPLRAAGSSGPNTIQLTATGTPSGGTYQWSTTSSKVSLGNTNSDTVTVTAQSQSSSVDDVPITVLYTVNNQSNTATKNISVQKPSTLSIASDSGSQQDLDCVAVFGGPDYNGVRRDILYRVMDQWGTNAIQFAGMPAEESFEAISNTCTGVPSTPNPSGGETASNGDFNGPDRLAMCSSSCMPADSNRNPTGTCTLAFNQTWKVNGITVRNNSVTITCTSVAVVPQ
jgi:hypothetical protein